MDAGEGGGGEDVAFEWLGGGWWSVDDEGGLGDCALEWWMALMFVVISEFGGK